MSITKGDGSIQNKALPKNTSNKTKRRPNERSVPNKCKQKRFLTAMTSLPEAPARTRVA